MAGKTKVKIVFKSEGFRALATSAEAQAMVDSHAQRIADAAGDGFEVRSSPGRGRARAAVITATQEAMAAEATDKALTEAIGRG